MTAEPTPTTLMDSKIKLLLREEEVMETEKETIIRLKKELRMLSNEGLCEIKLGIDSWLQIGSKDNGTTEQDWLTQGLWTELSRRGMIEQKYSPARIKAVKPKDYDTRRIGVQELLLKRVGRELDYQERVALGKVSGRALAKYLEWQDHFGLKVMLNSIQLVPEAIEASLPGYLECGMLGALITRQEVRMR